MNYIEEKIQDLENYKPHLTLSPQEIDAFWDPLIAECKKKPLEIKKTKVKTPHPFVEVYDITYKSYDDTCIHGWYIVPGFIPAKGLPGILHIPGYAWGRGYPEQYFQWVLMGMAVLAIDVRGQGGETGNNLPQTSGMTKGWLTQGILDKETSYYKAISIDTYRALDCLLMQEEIDPNRVCVGGSSQGGGLTLMTLALHQGAAAGIADVPNMCHMDLGVFRSNSSLGEIADYVKRFPNTYEQVMETLAYFDIMNLGHRIKTPVILSAGLKDSVCLPETIYAAYHRIAGPKEIHVYPFQGHGVSFQHSRKTIDFIRPYILEK